jgi:hypothetical protein
MMHRLHFFGGGHAMLWKMKAIALSIAFVGLFYIGRTIWRARRRPKVEEW